MPNDSREQQLRVLDWVQSRDHEYCLDLLNANSSDAVIRMGLISSSPQHVAGQEMPMLKSSIASFNPASDTSTWTAVS